MGIGNKLKTYPALHKIATKVDYLREEYVTLLPLKFYYLSAYLKREVKKVILFYPEKPSHYHVLRQICHFKGFTITNKPQEADAIVHFEDITYRKYDKVLRDLRKKHPVINYRCRDISKEKVDKIHKKAFGYGISINPERYKGKYVKKGNLNTLHDGIIMNRTEKPQPGYVYQRLINNEMRGELVEYRIPILGYNIPFVYLKYRPIANRFGSKNNRVKIVKPTTIISSDEYKKILDFSHLIGLDCGELDVLRDKVTGKLYIVDANNTPASPPYQLSIKEYIKALQIMSDAFQQAFLDS